MPAEKLDAATVWVDICLPSGTVIHQFPRFVFDVKAFRLFTGHQTEPRFFPKNLQADLPSTGKKNLYYKDIPPAVLDELWARFFEALQPLHVAGKLGSVLFQFPHWITAAPKAKQHVEHCAERMHPFLTAFEFRNESWLGEKHGDSTLAMERERGIVHVIVDAPEGVTKRAHTVWEATSPELAILRLHGRNASTWSGAEFAAERFNYEYSDQELRDLAPPIAQIAQRAARTHVLFNNCDRDVAQCNAATMTRLLNEIEVRADWNSSANRYPTFRASLAKSSAIHEPSQAFSRGRLIGW